jgi:hypothetical protein
MTDAAAVASEVNEEATDFEDEFSKLANEKDNISEVDDGLNDPIDTITKDDDLETKNQDGEPGDEDPAPEEDIYAGMSDETKAKFITMEEQNKDLNHRLSSDAGRVSGLQRKINGMEKEIQGIRKGDTAGEQPDNKQIAEAMGGTDEEWDAFKEDYPEVAKAIDSRLDKAGQATQETIDSTLTPIKESQEKAALKEAADATQASADVVTEIYPEWTEAVQKPEFASWLDSQPPGVQSLTDSDDPQDASALIGLYDSHLVASGLPTLKADPTNGVDTKDELTQKEIEANSIAARRAQQLEDGTTIPSKKSRIDPSSEPVDDFEAAFNFHAKRRENQRRRA